MEMRKWLHLKGNYFWRDPIFITFHFHDCGRKVATLLAPNSLPAIRPMPVPPKDAKGPDSATMQERRHAIIGKTSNTKQCKEIIETKHLSVPFSKKTFPRKSDFSRKVSGCFWIPSGWVRCHPWQKSDFSWRWLVCFFCPGFHLLLLY